MENKFSKYFTCFRESHNTQNFLLKMTEFRETKLSNGTKVGVITMELSKALDNLNHNLLLTKHKAYRFCNYIFIAIFLTETNVVK